MNPNTKKNLVLGGVLLLSCSGMVGAASAATDWKSMPGTSCSSEYGSVYCPIPREYFNRTGAASAFTGFTVQIEGSGPGLNCTIFSSPNDTPFYWWQTGVNKSRTDTGAINYSAAELASIPYFNNGIYLLQCHNMNYVQSYRWTEQGNQG